MQGQHHQANGVKKTGVRVYKIVILGDGGVGKSALTMQFVCHTFQDYHDPTIEDAYEKQAVIDGDVAKLDILDTAGQPEFTAMREQYMRQGEGFLICYSITDRRSFDVAMEYKKLIDRVRKRDDIPIILVGNKYDLEKQRKVTTEEGKSLARQFSCPFFETSAAHRHFVDDSFHTLIRVIRQKENLTSDEMLKNNTKKQSSKIHTFINKVFKPRS
ncbi:unnamed protein product [Owenia fusiformis]|uniref:small monomeric GTPase n=1 Tax=Owenia fusiformis TaxID=6347 RepID=A0A8J1XUL7_OWEFU|nr:unnamed protein product [Owenia fusiformis]